MKSKEINFSQWILGYKFHPIIEFIKTKEINFSEWVFSLYFYPLDEKYYINEFFGRVQWSGWMSGRCGLERGLAAFES